MSNDTQIKLAGEHGAAVSQQTQYGVRYPDGTTAWNVIPGTSIDIRALVETDHRNHGNHSDGWMRTVEEKAKAAKIDLAEYGAAHKFIKRTVILAVTDTEEV